MSKKVILEGYMVIPDNARDTVLIELENHKVLTRAEKGCITFEVTPTEHDCNTFNVYEEFVDKDAFDFHQLRVKESTWGKVSTNVERHYHITTHSNYKSDNKMMNYIYKSSTPSKPTLSLKTMNIT